MSTRYNRNAVSLFSFIDGSVHQTAPDFEAIPHSPTHHTYTTHAPHDLHLAVQNNFFGAHMFTARCVSACTDCLNQEE